MYPLPLIQSTYPLVLLRRNYQRRGRPCEGTRLGEHFEAVVVQGVKKDSRALEQNFSLCQISATVEDTEKRINKTCTATAAARVPHPFGSNP